MLRGVDELEDLLGRAAAPHLRNRRVLSLGVVRRGARRARAFGREVPEVPLFEIGSVTKVFTASLLAALVEEQVVRLEDPISRFLPDGPARANPALGRVTLEALATHTSGLPRLPTNLPRSADPANPYARYAVDDLHRGLETCPIAPSPGMEYSNLGMGLLGHLLAKAAGQPYEDALRARILAPLELGDTAIRLADAQRRRLVPGRSSRGKGVPNWDIPALEGAGALRSTTGDLLKFLEANLAEADAPPLRALRATHVPRTPHGACLGWQRGEVRGRPVLWHNGATGGYTSYVAFVPGAGVGVAVLSNYGLSLLESFWVAHADRIGRALLEELVPAGA
jgi:CubicO group peptidase (beta-lactamase class C family)